MAASYPGAVRTFTTKTNVVDVIDASHPDTLQDEVAALETYIGVNPHVSTAPNPAGAFITTSNTFASLVARLANIETGIVADSHSQYVKIAGGSTMQGGADGTIVHRIRARAGQTGALLRIESSDQSAAYMQVTTGGTAFTGTVTVGGNPVLTTGTGVTVSAAGVTGGAFPDSYTIAGTLGLGSGAAGTLLTNTSVSAASLTAANGGVFCRSTVASSGYVILSPGSTTTTGIVAFYAPNGQRAGYIGNGTGAPGSTDAGTVVYQANQHTFNGSVLFAGAITSQTTLAVTQANGGLELGALGSANTPYIDFHSSASNTDYDARIVASGGTGTAGLGSLSFTAGGGLYFASPTVVNNGAGPGSAFTVQSSAPGRGAEIVLSDQTAGAAAGNKFIRSITGGLEVVNHAYNAILLRLENGGALNTLGAITENGQRVYSPNSPQPMTIPIGFFFPAPINGLSKTKFIATTAMTLTHAFAFAETTAGATYQVYVNGALATGGTTSPATSITASTLHDFADVAVAAGDRIQINWVNATGSDIGITINAVK